MGGAATGPNLDGTRRPVCEQKNPAANKFAAGFLTAEKFCASSAGNQRIPRILPTARCRLLTDG
jgi:hypothetical protein